MKWKTKSGHIKDIPVHKYLVDWDDKQGSKFSEEVLDFLHTYWKHDVVCAELPVAGRPRCRFDFVNISKKIIIETDGSQHQKLILGYMHRTREDYKNQIKRDLFKDEIAELNGFQMVRITPDDLPKLSKDWFKQNFNISL